MSVLKIKNADGDWVGVTAIQGEQGVDGFSPKINVVTNTSSTYKLRVTTKDKDFTTPNLKGSGGSGGGNISSELGTIDNYKSFDGNNIPTYNMDLPPLPCFSGGTRYVFERPVRMMVYTGEPDENGNYDIDKYKAIDAEYKEGRYEVYVPTANSGYLTDYLIYNPIPKKEWDTWQNPNLLNILDVTDPKIHYDNGNGSVYMLPNCEIDIYNSGDAYITYHKFFDSLGNPYKKAGQYDFSVYNRSDFPFILDEPVMYYNWDKNNKVFSNPVEIPYPSEQWSEKMRTFPPFACGEDYTLDQDLQLQCCGAEEGWGNTILMNIATNIKDNNLLENRAYDLVIASNNDVGRYLSEHNAKPIAPAMYVGLKALKNYTIETTAGDCAIILSPNNGNKFITKRTEICYPTTTKSIILKKKEVQNIGESNGDISTGIVSGKNKLETGTVVYVNVVDTSEEPEGMIEVPTAISCPNVYLKRGESYTFQVEDEDDMYGIWVACLDEEDYKGIKIVEGIEPYSKLMEERLASGATKFNLKVYNCAYDDNEIMAEYNIKLSDNTTENDYCRFLSADTIKHFDLDDFTMNGHNHDIESLDNVPEFVESLKVPKMVLSTSTLADGQSELAENTFHFVYSDE